MFNVSNHINFMRVNVMNVVEFGVGLLWMGGVVLVTLVMDYRFKCKYRLLL